LRRGGVVGLSLASAASAALFVFVPQAGAQTAPGAVTLEPAPATVTPQPGENARLLLIVRNGSGVEAQNLCLSWMNDTGTRLASMPKSKVLKRLPAGADKAWTIVVSTPDVFVPGKVFFRLNYALGATPHIATTALDVTSPIPTKLDDIAGVEIRTTLESLDEQHDGTVYLLVTNKSATKLRVVDVVASGPPFVTFKIPQFTSAVEPVKHSTPPSATSPSKPKPRPTFAIGPNETKKLPVTVLAKGRVRSGKHLLLFDVHLSWGTSRHIQNAHVITTQQAQFGVLGLSEVLTVVGVPSFLLLPGFLMLIAGSILYGFWRPAGASRDLGLFDAKSPQFWAVAVSLSIVMAVAYPRLGGHSYLSDYGLRDVIYVWSIAIVIGVAACAVVVGVLKELLNRRTPKSDDDQIEILRKIDRQGLGLNRVVFEFKSGTKTHNGYLIQPRDNSDKVWLSPMIDVTVVGSGTPATELQRRLNTQTSPGKLADTMKSNRRGLEIEWDRQDGPDRPYQVSAEDLKAANEKPAEPIVRVH
jgi:hypothetical protein